MNTSRPYSSPGNESSSLRSWSVPSSSASKSRKIRRRISAGHSDPHANPDNMQALYGRNAPYRTCFTLLFSQQIRQSLKKILQQQSVNRSARSKRARSRCRKKDISAVPTESAAAIGKCWSISYNLESDQENGHEKMRLTFASAEVNLIFRL